MNTELNELRDRLDENQRRLERAERRARTSTACALGALALTGLVNIHPAALAQSPGTTLASLVAQISGLQSQQKTDEGREKDDISAAKKQEQADISSLKDHEQTDIQAVQNQEQNDVSALQSQQAIETANAITDQANIGALRTLTASFRLSSDPYIGGTNTLLTIRGVNVQIVNGMGSTETKNGLGNLIVGYNEAGSGARTGSHNIVTGIYNNYTSEGGILGGYANSLGGPEEFCVGEGNAASGTQSTVTGGQNNGARGDYSSVSGGSSNVAGGPAASVSGGQSNTAQGIFASITAGQDNGAYGSASSITGGQFNVVGNSSNPGTSSNLNAPGGVGAVGGGQSNTATGLYTTVSGGQSNTATGNYTAVSGGYNRYQSHDDGWTGGHYATDGP